MAFSTDPIYSAGPVAGVVNVPATAKTVLTDISNAGLLVAANATRWQSFASVFAQATATLVAGKLMLFLYDTTTAFPIETVIFAAGTVTTTTNPIGTNGKLAFGFSDASKLWIPPTYSLYIANSVAQTAGALTAHAQIGKLY